MTLILARFPLLNRSWSGGTVILVEISCITGYNERTGLFQEIIVRIMYRSCHDFKDAEALRSL